MGLFFLKALLVQEIFRSTMALRTFNPLAFTTKQSEARLHDLHLSRSRRENEIFRMNAIAIDVLEQGTDNLGDEEDLSAQSAFGTKQYWNEMYSGMGDFNSEQYSWYYGWETIQPFWRTSVRLVTNELGLSKQSAPSSARNGTPIEKQHHQRVLLPGIGNDSDLVYNLYSSGWTDVTAIDYSPYAIERQMDTLSYLLPEGHRNIQLLTMDARYLDASWTASFDIILEKGTLDAIYLSCENDSLTQNMKLAVSELYRVLKPGGVCMSISGVVPEHVRRELFSTATSWEWIRDGSEDLQAGCFIFRKIPH